MGQQWQLHFVARNPKLTELIRALSKVVVTCGLVRRQLWHIGTLPGKPHEPQGPWLQHSPSCPQCQWWCYCVLVMQACTCHMPHLTFGSRSENTVAGWAGLSSRPGTWEQSGRKGGGHIRKWGPCGTGEEGGRFGLIDKGGLACLLPCFSPLNLGHVGAGGCLEPQQSCSVP